MLFGALEAGGTKMVCAIGNEQGEILERISIPTQTPDGTMPKLAEFFLDKGIAALGIGCFGPIDLNRSSKTYGYITTTPKLPWKNYDICGYFREQLNVPVGFDTDVNGSMLGEATWGCARGLDSAIYITVGTGIGVGIMADGKLLHGMLHPEGGHILMPVRSDDTYKGKCPYHGTCLEGLASGPAIEARWGAPAKELADRPQVWDLEAYYLAHALTSYIMILSPQKIILGGGVMHQTHLMGRIHQYVKDMIGGYLVTKELEDLDSYIVLPSLNDDQGILGALKLGMDELDREKGTPRIS
ncbi:MAG: ROK family protein [Hungatella sp.]|jgi:fructokinase|nr:ROK family protein [Hungatella sp.]